MHATYLSAFYGADGGKKVGNFHLDSKRSLLGRKKEELERTVLSYGFFLSPLIKKRKEIQVSSYNEY